MTGRSAPIAPQVVVWDAGGQGAGTAGFLQRMTKVLPPMMHVLKDIAGVELPGYLAALATEDGPAPAVVPPPNALPSALTPASAPTP